jgi:hypothetical protein
LEHYEGLDVVSSIHPKLEEVLGLDPEQTKVTAHDLLDELWNEPKL